MKQKRTKRLLSLLTSLCLLLALLPVGALAEDTLPDGSEGIEISKETPDTIWTCGGDSRATWRRASGLLTLSGDGTIEAADKHGIELPAYAILVVEPGANWSVTGASGMPVYDGIHGGGNLTVDIAEGASLTAKRGDSQGRIVASGGLYASGTLEVTVAAGGSLTAVGENEGGNVNGYGGWGLLGWGITLHNNGTVTAKGGSSTTGALNGAGIKAYQPGLTVTGAGTLRCEGISGIEAMTAGGGGELSGTANIKSGTVIALGIPQNKEDILEYGVNTFGGSLTVDAGATVIAVGSDGGVGASRIEGPVVQITGTPETGKPDAPLDLSDAKAYLYDDGIATWDPTASTFTMTAFDQSTFLGNFKLSKGVKFPSDAAKTIAVTMSANTAIEGENDPAIHAGVSALTFETPYAGGDSEHDPTPTVEWGTASSAARVDFIGGNFKVNGAIDAPVTLRNSAGRLEIFGADDGGAAAALPQGITITPPEGHHSELMTHTQEVGQNRHLAGSPSNEEINHKGAETSYIAAIVAGTVAPPSGGSSSPSTYAVVYKANYANAPKDIRDSGYRAGASVTLKGADAFAAPADKVFAGWAESADGEAKYQGGEVMKMPSKTLDLYAVWQDIVPGLNKTDHMAYVAGYPDGTVRPGGYITREETATIFYRLLNEPTRAKYETDTHSFSDVAKSRWSNAAVATLANAGILKGRTSGHFAPGEHITRAEFAAIAARFDSDEYTGENLFPDIAGHWAADEINRAAQKGWVEGDRNGLFRPNDNITRAEAVTLLNRVLERAPETADDLLADMRTFKDNLDTGAWYYLALQEAANGHDYKRKADKIHETWTALQ